MAATPNVSDGELLVLAQQNFELTEIAQQSLASEISRRGLKRQSEELPARPDPSPPFDSSGDEDRELVEICTVWSLPDALQLQTLLEGRALRCRADASDRAGSGEMSASAAVENPPWGRATVAIGYRAIQNGFETLCTTAAELVEELSNTRKKGCLQESLLTYTQPHALIVDEVGYLTYGPDAANLLFHVVNDRT
jgi:hypothetical protein